MSAVLQFEQVANTLLYEARVAGSVGWAGYLLPTAPSNPVAGIPIDQSLSQYSGAYLFATARPALIDSDPAGFVQQANAYIKANAGFNRAAVWLLNSPAAPFGNFAHYGFAFSPNISGLNILRSDLNAALGSNLNFYVLTNLYLSVDTAAGALVLSIRTGTNPLIGLQNGADGVGITVGDANMQRAAIPFSGPNTGCFVFAAQIAPAVTFGAGAYMLGFRYVARDKQHNRRVTLSYPAFAAGQLPNSLACTGAVDPADPTNTRLADALLRQGYLRTGFALSGAPVLASMFRSATGRAISLIPQGAGTAGLPARAGAFALASAARANTPPGQGVVYFTPAGAFGLSVDTQPAGAPQQLLCGLFGSERVSFVTYDPAAGAGNDTLLFLPSQPAYAPVFPFSSASLDTPDSGKLARRLTADYQVPWATLVNGAGHTSQYSAEPEGSPLYAPTPPTGAPGAAPAVLLTHPPAGARPQGLGFPLGPDAGLAPCVDGQQRAQFESQILAATRMALISGAAGATWRARAAATARHARAALAVTPTYATTPQGLVAQIDPGSGAYLNVALAQSADRSGSMQPFAFGYPTRQLQDALQTNQLFLVAVNDQNFDNPKIGAHFANAVTIAGWTLTAQVGKGATLTSYRNVLILKFCAGSLQERVSNPNRWTAAADFSLAAEASPDTATVAYTGLSQWLQQYIDDGIARASGRSAAFYQNFKQIATDPSWNGVIVLQADLAANDLPPQIQGLAAGIEFAHFTAHHFGFSVSRVVVDQASGVITLDGPSSMFGLIDYTNPAYALNLAAGVNPDQPIPVQTTNDFDFSVLQLQSLFENSRLSDFKSNVQLTANRLFGAPVLATYSNGQPAPANGVVLDGSYIDQNGVGVYVFQQTQANLFTLDSNLLPALLFSRVQFNTLGPRDGGASVASRFLIWGNFDFAQLNDQAGALLDVLSFGSPPGTFPAALGAGLAFSNLAIDMSFAKATPNAVSYALDTANLAYDLNASQPRDESLFKGFGLQLKSFISAQDKTPADYGFLPVSSGLSLRQLGKRWFGVVYDVTLGGPGALASAAGFSSSMLLAWAPDSAASDSTHGLFMGLSLPGAAPGAKLFSLQGVIKVAVGAIALLRQPVPGAKAGDPPFFYCLRLDDIGIKIFGIVKLPPDATIQFFLFGDPSNTGSLGWYAAYVASDTPGADQQRLGLVQLP